jgi:hypothetical protein
MVDGEPPAGPAAAFVPLAWSGLGPIISWPELVSVFWGDFTAAQVSSMTTWLAAYAGYLRNAGAPAGQQCVVSQYGVRGASVGASHTELAEPRSATEADVHNLVDFLQQQGSLPEYSPNRLFIVFTHGISFPDYGVKGGWCGKHEHWDGGQYFAIVPWPTASGCGSSSPEKAWQSIASHEINEAATDPGVGSGWVSGRNEGGDTCNWQYYKMPFGTIQLFEDNAQQSCSAWTPHRGKEWYTTRGQDGRWSNTYETVEAQERNNPGPFTDVACAGAGDTLHVVGLSQDGRQWHTLRDDQGTWQRNYYPVPGQEGNNPGPFCTAACAGVEDDLHLLGLTRAGQMWHTIRYPDSSWQANYDFVPGQDSSDPGPFTDLACAGLGDRLHVLGLARDGRVWITARYAGGNWEPRFGLLDGQDSNNPFMAIALADADTTLHVVGLSMLGQQWHTFRDNLGAWHAFGLIEGQEQNDPGPFLELSCAGVGDTLHVVGLSLKGEQWHTTRDSNGTWQPDYGLVESEASNNPGRFLDVSCAGIGNTLVLIGIA